MGSLRVMMIGDVVGDPGLNVLESTLCPFILENQIDFVIANGENIFGGFGITAPLLERLFAVGVNIVTGGNHIWEQREFWPVLESEERMLRPMNYPMGSPGRGWVKAESSAKNGEPLSLYIVNLQGREYMTPLDCPFKTFDSLIESIPEKSIVFIDFHAESSSEKEALAYYIDGRASCIAGTHTHVQTADERILPGGTAYITDLGMTGVLDGVIGMDPKICIDRARSQVLYRMEPAKPDENSRTAIQGLIADIDIESGRAVSVKRV